MWTETIYQNTSAIWQQDTHPTNHHPAVQQEPHKKAYLLTKTCRIVSRKNNQEKRHGIKRKNDKTDRARGLGKKTRQETEKGNQMTALRFQTGGEPQTPRPPFRVSKDVTRTQQH